MNLSKRRKFLITSLALSMGFAGINFLDSSLRVPAIGALTILTIILFSWSLLERLALNTTLLVLILPTLFTLGVGTFWFLLPSTIFARIPIILVYGIGVYALCLTSNIYTVSTIHTIALMRAAKGVGFLLTLVTGFLLYDAILSVRFNPVVSAALIFSASLPLFLQGLWASTLESKLKNIPFKNSVLFSFGIAQIAVLLYFWPVTVVVGSLFLTIAVYVLLGLGQAYEEGRLFKQTSREYLTVGLLVFIAMIMVTRWRGF